MRTAIATFSAVLVVMVLAPACSSGSDESSPQVDFSPLRSARSTASEDTAGEDTAGESRTGDSTAGDTKTAGKSGLSGPSSEPDSKGIGTGEPTGSEGSDPQHLAIAVELVRTYDEVVTELAVDPALSSVPTSDVRQRWAALVQPSSSLYSAVLEGLVEGPLVQGTRLLPGPDGVSYRHHVTQATFTSDGYIEFSWCGYAPGVRVEAVSGRVVDDNVAKMLGVGRATRVADAQDPSDRRWVLDSFDHLDLQVMPPGSVDPCTEGNR